MVARLVNLRICDEPFATAGLWSSDREHAVPDALPQYNVQSFAVNKICEVYNTLNRLTQLLERTRYSCCTVQFCIFIFIFLRRTTADQPERIYYSFVV